MGAGAILVFSNEREGEPATLMGWSRTGTLIPISEEVDVKREKYSAWFLNLRIAVVAMAATLSPACNPRDWTSIELELSCV